MLVIANKTLRDSIYGMVYRVSVGTTLSIVDAATDIYVVTTYYESDELIGQANILLCMITGNMFVQFLLVLGQYRKKPLAIKIKEVLICLLFLRPAVDAYRVSKNLEDKEVTVPPLVEMFSNKCVELATESIPGCVLQLYVCLMNPEEAGTFSLISIAISALTTGYSSAMIGFDMDVDVAGRRNQPQIYGYIPDDNGLRGRCFLLMMLMR